MHDSPYGFLFKLIFKIHTKWPSVVWENQGRDLQNSTSDVNVDKLCKKGLVNKAALTITNAVKFFNIPQSMSRKLTFSTSSFSGGVTAVWCSLPFTLPTPDLRSSQVISQAPLHSLVPLALVGFFCFVFSFSVGLLFWIVLVLFDRYLLFPAISWVLVSSWGELVA